MHTLHSYAHIAFICTYCIHMHTHCIHMHTHCIHMHTHTHFEGYVTTSSSCLKAPLRINSGVYTTSPTFCADLQVSRSWSQETIKVWSSFVVGKTSRICPPEHLIISERAALSGVTLGVMKILYPSRNLTCLAC